MTVTPFEKSIMPEAPLDFEQVKQALQLTMNVGQAAQLLGKTTRWLSAYLYRGKRITWWFKEKARWKRERKRAREKRYRDARRRHDAQRAAAWAGQSPFVSLEEREATAGVEETGGGPVQGAGGRFRAP
jgi:hypothetical protein